MVLGYRFEAIYKGERGQERKDEVGEIERTKSNRCSMREESGEGVFH